MIKPLFNNVLIKPLEAEKKTVGGLFIPDSSRERPQIGEAMAIGKEVKEVKIKDKVLYKKWGGNEIKVDNEEWMIIEEEDILAIQ